MANCTTLTVLNPSPTLTKTNLGFGDSTSRFASCTDVPASYIGTAIYIYFDYVVTNPFTRIDGQSNFNAPSVGPSPTNWYLLNPPASSTAKIDTGYLYAAGNYDSLTTTAVPT